MPKSPKKSRKPAKRLALSLLAILFTGAAATPVLAATNVIQVDTGAAAIIATFAILMLSIIFEVWRFTNHNDQPGAPRRGIDWRQGLHE